MKQICDQTVTTNTTSAHIGGE